MKRAPSFKPAVILPLALFIALLLPGIGWTPKAHGFAFSAAGLPGRGFLQAVAPTCGGRCHGFPFEDASKTPSTTTPKFSQAVR